VHSLRMRWGESSDIDLFLYATSPQEATPIITRRIFYSLAINNESWIVVRSRGVVNIHRWNDNFGTVAQKVQILLRVYDSPAEVILGFDCDCICCAYVGRTVWVTPRCLAALRTGVNVSCVAQQASLRASSCQVCLSRFPRVGAWA
jgi:hypothetical protein